MAEDVQKPKYEVVLESEDGSKLSPSLVNIGDLGEALLGLEKALKGMKEDLEQDSRASDEISVGLVAIRSGSVGLGFASTNNQWEDPFLFVCKVISHASYQSAPEKVRAGLEIVRSVLARMKCLASFRTFGSSENLAILDSQAKITPEYIEISGETEVLGTVISVGGKKPNTHLLVPGHSKAITCTLSDDGVLQAKELGRHIYEEVRLLGQATWNAVTGDLVRFHVKEVRQFDMIPASLTIAELRERFGKYFSGDDSDRVDEFLENTRGGDLE